MGGEKDGAKTEESCWACWASWHCGSEERYCSVLTTAD